jgi:hypothetical protein
MTESSTVDRTDDVEEEAPRRRQYGALVEVVLDSGDPEVPEVFTVHVLNPDRIRYEKTRARQKDWPDPRDAGSHMTTFITWAAAKRAGQTELSWEQWEVALLDYDEVKVTTADPTPADSLTRRYVELALASGIPVAAWLLEDDETVATAMTVLDERNTEDE